MKSMILAFVLISVMDLVCCGNLLITYSSNRSIIEAPGIPRNATVQNVSYYYGGVPDFPQAKMIWDGDGSAQNCTPNFLIKENFTLKCRNPITIRISVDDYFWLTLNNQNKSYPQYGSPRDYIIKTRNLTCGSKLDLLINATNQLVYDSKKNSYICEPQAKGGVEYAVFTDDCSVCKTNEFFNQPMCGCMSTSCSIPHSTGYDSASLSCNCEVGYQWVASLGACASQTLNCSAYMNACNYCESQSKCLDCVDNTYGVMNGHCVACSDLIEGCVTCIYSTICLECADGYTLDDETDICIKPIQYLVSNASSTPCSNFGVAQQVDINLGSNPNIKWIWNGGMSAHPCTDSCFKQSFRPHCLNTSLNLFMQITSTTISQMSYLLNLNEQSSTNKVSFVASRQYQSNITLRTFSWGCRNKFIYSDQNHFEIQGLRNNDDCTVSNPVPAGVRYRISGQCPGCTYGLFHNPEKCGCDNCSLYLSNCEACSSKTQCKVCVGNTYQVSNGICMTCNYFIGGCEKCSSPTSCIACKSGYTLVNSTTCAKEQVITYSSTKTQVISPGAPRNATLTTNTYPGSSFPVPDAQWIWDSQGNQPICDQTIKISDTFTAKCLDSPLILSISADGNYSYVAASSPTSAQTGDGSGLQPAKSFVLSTAGMTCNTTMTIVITAQNENSDCSTNPAALKYSVVNKCSGCTDDKFWDQENCVCALCSKAMEGCGVCSNSSACLSCSNSSYLYIGQVCNRCDNYINGCSVCKDETTCKACWPAYVFNGTSCVPCSSFSFTDAAASINSVNSCVCSAKYKWSTQGPKCIIDCSQVAHGTNTIGDFSCGCEEKYMWDQNTVSCVVNCNSTAITHSAGFVANSPDCACVSKYSWDAAKAQCNLDCSQITYATSLSSPISCNCQQYRQWNATILECELNCSSITYATVLVSTNVCSCINKFVWNAGAFKCYPDCHTYANSTGVANGTGCICVSPYSWNTAQMECSLDCSKINNTNGISISTAVCICLSPYLWHEPTSTCVKPINCSTLSYTRPKLLPASLTCSCVGKFFWNYTSLGCEVDCLKVLLSDSSTPKPTPTSCACLGPATWSSNTASCILPCPSIPNTNTTYPQPIDSCTCNYKYSWNPTNYTCDINCPSIPYTVTGTPLPDDSCLCKTNFYWNSSSPGCNINCSKFNNTNTTAPTTYYYWTPTDCRCKAGYSWLSRIPDCVRDCFSVYYSTGRVNSDGSCECVSYFVWDAANTTCKLDCTKFDKSTGVNNGSLACLCAQKYTWSQTYFGCIVDCTTYANSNNMTLGTRTCGCNYRYIWANEASGCVKIF